MLFSPGEQLPVLTCSSCGGTGKERGHLCKTCSGMIQGMYFEGTFAYLSEKYTEYDIKLRHARKLLQTFRIIGALIVIFSALAWFFIRIRESERISDISTFRFWFGTDIHVYERALVWIAVLALLYIWYRFIITRTPHQVLRYDHEPPHFNSSPKPVAEIVTWEQVKKIPRNKRVDIKPFLTTETRETLETATTLAREYGSSQVTMMHLFYALLSLPSIVGIGVRLQIPTKGLQGVIGKSFGKRTNSAISPVFSPEVENIIFRSYELTRKYKDPYIRAITLFKATVEQATQIQEMLYDLEVDQVKLDNVIEWVRIRELLTEKYHAFRRAAAGVSKYGMDKAMTAIATPTLNQFSHDLTLKAKFGDLEICVGREKEIEEILRMIEGGNRNIMLVGDHGVGKLAIIQGIVERMVKGEVPKMLEDKRLVQLSLTTLLAGTTASGAQERLLRMMNEVSRARNIILFIDNIHDLVGITDSQGKGLDVGEALAEHLKSGQFTMFATTLPDAYTQTIVNSEIGSVFSKVDVREMDVNQTIRVLESRAGIIEHQNNIFFSYDALEKSAVLADKFFYEHNLPESALSLMTEAASYARGKHGENSLVSGNDVGVVVGEKTGIPTASITDSESSKLLKLEEEMHTQVVGQSEAVSLVANALRRARASMRSEKRPIANFLFLGPTGVGKTELAKTIARVYFGGEERMIRIDMSEYQDKSAVYRLIGQPGNQGTGILTEAVRKSPFSLVLLDELEKADPDILNLFLQVFDDGRLTDSTGRVVDFTNTIIIATSNAGTDYIQKSAHDGGDIGEIRERLIKEVLPKYYRLEFLNRFDGIVLFKPLSREEIKTVAGLMLKSVARDLENKGVGLVIEDAALDALADVGFDPEFGARPMRRAIQDRVENELANLILKGELKRRDTVIIGEGISFRVEHALT